MQSRLFTLPGRGLFSLYFFYPFLSDAEVFFRDALARQFV